MSHSDVMKWFERYFPAYAGDNLAMWFPNGKNSIRVRQKNGQEFVFTYNGPTDWLFETISHFLDRLKGGNK